MRISVFSADFPIKVVRVKKNMKKLKTGIPP